MPTTKVIPERYFANWCFGIRPELWPALGVVRREYIDKEKTKTKRDAAKARGIAATVLPRIKATYFAYAVDAPPKFAFEEGDIFHATQGARSIQIGKIKEKIEVWARGNGPTYACWVSEQDLADWLASGKEPPEKRIDRFQSMSEIAKYYVLMPSLADPPIPPK